MAEKLSDPTYSIKQHPNYFVEFLIKRLVRVLQAKDEKMSRVRITRMITELTDVLKGL